MSPSPRRLGVPCPRLCGAGFRAVQGAAAGKVKRRAATGRATASRMSVMTSERGRCRHDRPALLARPEFFRFVEIAVGLGHRILAVVVDDVSLLVQEIVAVQAKPNKPIDVSGHTGTLDDQLKCIRCEPRRMRN